jgi:hypothetical protein
MTPRIAYRVDEDDCCAGMVRHFEENGVGRYLVTTGGLTISAGREERVMMIARESDDNLLR